MPLIKIMNHPHIVNANGQVSVLFLPDKGTAFDTEDHLVVLRTHILLLVVLLTPGSFLSLASHHPILLVHTYSSNL